MKLDNATPFPARLFTTVIEERRMFATLVARISHEIVDGRLRPAELQRWPVSPGPWEGPWGPMPGDQVPYRGGVDLLIFGHARAPNGRPAPRIDVAVELGTRWRTQITAWGHRTWQTSLGGLVPGAPEPVRSVPLTLAHAYGGSDEWDGLQVPFVDNPAGRGFYLEQSHARGQPLPNLEDPGALVRRWDDRPEPVGTVACAQNFGPRVRRGVQLADDQQSIRGLHPTFFNDAFPGMIAPAMTPGERLVVRGVRDDGPLTFTLPDTPLRVEMRIGDDSGVRTPVIDQIGVEPDARLVYITYRYPFRYTLTPRQRRTCRLSLATAS